jgi:hypothetical protein
MSEGQRVLIMSSWLWRAVMTTSVATPLRGVEMCEVGIVRLLGLVVVVVVVELESW